MLEQNLQEEFNKEVFKNMKQSQELLKCNHSRFMQMYNRYNNNFVTVANVLALDRSYITEGILRLWKMKKLNLTVEALVVDPKYRSLFSKKVIDICKSKLKKLGYNWA